MVTCQRLAPRQGKLRRQRGTWAATFALSAAATLSACASHSEHSLTLADGDTGSTVHAELGQAIEVTLHTIGPGSYGSPSSSAPVLSFEGEDDPKAQNPGGPTQLYEFHAENRGTVTVTIAHSVRPDPFSVTVVVQ